MKIVCESCGAKYSIADDRVTGKVFKIRCKRCSEVIVVRGDQQAAPAAGAPAAAPQGQDAIWHVVVDGEQAGPYSPAQLGEMLNSGAVDWDAYVWTEGFDNWSPMRDVADLVALITGQGQPQAAAQAAPAYRPQTQTLTGQPSMGADPFADDAGPSDAGLFGGGGAAPDLFGRGAQASAYGGGAEVATSTPSPAPRVAPERALTGARNENSVLFSLKNLQALATGSGTPSVPAPTSGGGDRGAGFASGEGSGLIDIRALASTTGIGDGADAPGQKDELLSLGSQGGAFGTLGSPMMSPTRDDGDGKQKTLIWALVVGVGFVCVAGVAIAYLLVSQKAASAPPVVSPVVTAPVPVAPAPVAAPAPTPSTPSEGELAAAKAAEREKGASHEGEKSGSSSGTSSHRKHESSGAKTGGSESAGGEPLLEPKKDAPSKPSGPRTIDDLLDGALSGSSAKQAKKAEADDGAKSNLPMTPSRDDVLSAMNGVKSAVQACGKGGGGVATVTVNVAGASGHVTTAEVNGVSGPAGSCIAQAVRKAQFNKFQQKVFKVTFPYKL